MQKPILINEFKWFSHTHRSQVHAIKHTTMQHLQTSTGSIMGCTEEINGFKRDTPLGCHLCHKSICEISAPLDLPWSTVSAVIVKWKCLRVTTAQLWSSRPGELTELSAEEKKLHILLHHSLQTSTLALEATSARDVWHQLITSVSELTDFHTNSKKCLPIGMEAIICSWFWKGIPSKPNVQAYFTPICKANISVLDYISSKNITDK